MRKSAKYALTVLRHKWYVLTYGLEVGGIPLGQLLIHDLSKFSRAEFVPYRDRDKDTDVSNAAYAVAWKHHWSGNPHHWEYWVREGIPIAMPEVYVREMVADWRAANRVYGGELSSWFSRKFPKMNLHPETVRLLTPLIAPYGLCPPV